MSIVSSPIDSDKIEAKKPFDALGRLGDNVVLPSSDPAQLNRFILHSKGYSDLQAYVLSGKEFPTSHSIFDARIPKSAIRRLSDFNRKIYDKTRDTVVAVGSTCQNYHLKRLDELVSACQGAVAYSDGTIEVLETAESGNLRYNLDILMDEKYTSADEFDDVYRTAKKVAIATLDTLRDEANYRQSRTYQIAEALIREDTLEIQPNVKFLIKQYQPYITNLDKDLADNVANLNKMLQDAKQADADSKKQTHIVLATSWLGPVGWIPTAIHGSKSEDFSVAHNELQRQIAQLKLDRKEEMDLAAVVIPLLVQCTDIDQTMTNTITAISELISLFYDQAECYEKIAAYLDRVKTSLDMVVQKSRRQLIQYQRKICVEKVKKLKVVSEEFNRSTLTQVEL